MAKIPKEKIEKFQKELIEWFSKRGRHFPWREVGISSYKLIISETLLQRTKAETVSNFYHTFITTFPDWESLASANISTIENFLKPIGLYRQRAKRMKNLAIEMRKREGVFPQEREELETIPFLGQYIANAVQLFVFEIPMPLLDVNMARVLERYFGERKMADIRFDPYLQALSQDVVKHVNSKELNWAILDFAALICKAKNPQHEICPLKQDCKYYLAQKTNA
jgi:A/G-specific adenine glycosylase